MKIGCDLSNAEDSEPNGLTIVKTKFGKPKLCYEGHYYTIDKVTGTAPNNKIALKCEKQGSWDEKCNGRVHSIGFFEPL
ncbi:unnamed protein product [Brachionus calyciflorus]|uniref:FLYWCH-type domain-containing protein n=1 Tax=Brachionus calyciflorus TaxID=104777 RepID=A0A814JG67_9BILA|nr:unnamed protein product [Brachionus calyciflorus]